MKNYQLIACASIAMFLIASNVLSDFYKYKDQNGVLRFTDNLSEVPENQRHQVDKYKEYINSKNQDRATIPINPKSETKESEEEISQEARILGKKITQLQAKLKKEYEKLVDEKKAIEQLDQKKGPKTSTDIKILEGRAAQLNKRIQAYNNKKETYVQTIREYQQKIQSLSSETPKN